MWARSTRTTATSLFVSHQQSAFRQSFSSVVRRKRPDVIVALWSKQKGPSSQQQQQQQQQRPHLLESRLRSKTHFQLDSSSTKTALAKAVKRPSTSTASSVATMSSHKESEDSIQDIEDLHRQACLQGSSTYIDPDTGFTVFTELAHLKRGRCCGSQCRHCPYGWTNVRSGVRRDARVTSGDKDAIESMLSNLQTHQWTYNQQERQKEQPAQSSSSSSALIANTLPKTVASNSKKTGGRHGGELTDKNVPYTRGGDKGSSQLLTGERRSKTDPAFEAMGTVDELCSVVGVVYAHLQQERLSLETNKNNHNSETPSSANLQTSVEEMDEWMLQIMSRLFDAGSHLAAPRSIVNDDDDASDAEESSRFVADGIGGGFHEQHVTELEEWIDLMTEDLPELTSFLLPASPSVAVAQCHVARTVCRRAERYVVPLVTNGTCDPNALAYLNRLSDFWFTAARWIHRHVAKQASDVEYKKPHRGAKQRQRININSNND